MNHFLQVYTILPPGKEYTQYNCPWADQEHICKYAVKVYKMIHPEVKDTISSASRDPSVEPLLLSRIQQLWILSVLYIWFVEILMVGVEQVTKIQHKTP